MRQVDVLTSAAMGWCVQEVGLLRRYNDKPLLTRPQQKFFLTPTYLEVDLDIHNYAYLARKVPLLHHGLSGCLHAYIIFGGGAFCGWVTLGNCHISL